MGSPSKLKQQEEAIAITSFGSARHLVVVIHTLRPPLRGGDCDQLYITAGADPRDPMAGPTCWTGTAKPEARIPYHKTSHLKGTIVRPVPQSLRRVIKASLEKQPRATVFVSPADGQPFDGEASIVR